MEIGGRTFTVETGKVAELANAECICRYGDPVEMCGPVIFLCSEAASFVNGAVLPVDGGFSSYWGV